MTDSLLYSQVLSSLFSFFFSSLFIFSYRKFIHFNRGDFAPLYSVHFLSFPLFTSRDRALKKLHRIDCILQL